MFLSLALSLYYLTLFLLGRIAVPGWTTLFLLVLFFFGPWKWRGECFLK
jgi:hypothetical protein